MAAFRDDCGLSTSTHYQGWIIQNLLNGTCCFASCVETHWQSSSSHEKLWAARDLMITSLNRDITIWPLLQVHVLPFCYGNSNLDNSTILKLCLQNAGGHPLYRYHCRQSHKTGWQFIKRPWVSKTDLQTNCGVKSTNNHESRLLVSTEWGRLWGL